MEAKRKGLRRLTLKRLLLMELLLLLFFFFFFFFFCLARHGEEKPKREQGGQRGRATLETAVNAEEDSRGAMTAVLIGVKVCLCVSVEGCECERTR